MGNNIETKFDLFVNEGWIKKLIDPTGELFSKKKNISTNDELDYDENDPYGEENNDEKIERREQKKHNRKNSKKSY